MLVVSKYPSRLAVALVLAVRRACRCSCHLFQFFVDDRFGSGPDQHGDESISLAFCLVVELIETDLQPMNWKLRL